MKRHILNILFSLVLVASLSACAAGPDFQHPIVVAPHSWQHTRTNNVRSITTSAQPVPAWWQSFHDPVLIELIKRVRLHNLDLQLANWRLQQSRAALAAVSGKALPTIGAGLQYQRLRSTSEGHFDPSGNNGMADFDLWQGGLNASWELDVWGRVDRDIEAAVARMQETSERRRGVLIMVISEAARDYIQLRYVQSLHAIVQKNLALETQTLSLIRIRIRNGVATRLELAETRAQLAEIKSRLPTLVKLRTRLINGLSYLVGEKPGSMEDLLRAPATIPAVPDLVPIGLPSELAQRRPDIRAAEAALHVATARIGIAQANFYPHINLTGHFGYEALSLATFGDWNTHTFGIGPTISLPIFTGGSLRGMLELRQAQQKQAAVHFQQVVLNAWREVDDALTAYRNNQQQYALLTQAVRDNKTALKHANQRYLAGAIDLLNVLTLQRRLLATQQQACQSQAHVSIALVTLYKSLGGGWEK